MTDGEWKSASWKQEEDYSKETSELLEQVNADLLPVLLRSSNKSIDDFAEDLQVLEKKARLGGDTISTTRLAVEIIHLYRSQRSDDAMLQKLEFLMKRRAQPKQVQSAMIAECAKVLDDIPNDEEHTEQRADFLRRLIHQTSGKIHLELENARFTVQLTRIEEGKGNRREAADMLQELQIETITNMPRSEKMEIVLHLMSLTLETNDLDRFPVVARKISSRALAKRGTRDYALRYFKFLTDYYLRLKQYFTAGRSQLELYTLATTSGNKSKSSSSEDGEEQEAVFISNEMSDLALDSLSHCAVYVLISEHLSAKERDDQAEFAAFASSTYFADRTEWLESLKSNRRLRLEIPLVHELVSKFTSPDLIRETVMPRVKDLAASHPALVEHDDREQDMYTRLSEHDLLVTAKSYSQIRLGRLSRLVNLSEAECENYIMSLVSTKALFAKIDRVEGLVVFTKKRSPAETVQDWNTTVGKMTSLIDTTAQLIVKERMQSDLSAVAASKS